MAPGACRGGVRQLPARFNTHARSSACSGMANVVVHDCSQGGEGPGLPLSSFRGRASADKRSPCASKSGLATKPRPSSRSDSRATSNALLGVRIAPRCAPRVCPQSGPCWGTSAASQRPAFRPLPDLEAGTAAYKTVPPAGTKPALRAALSRTENVHSSSPPIDRTSCVRACTVRVWIGAVARSSASPPRVS